MLTRSELQSVAGLSRKALRIYEEQGLLKPTVLRDYKVLFDENEVKTAVFIADMRKAGIALSVIETLLTTDDSATIEAVKADLGKAAERFLHAIAQIDERQREMEKKVFEMRYGGFWAQGSEATVHKDAVSGFVCDTISALRDVGMSGDKIAAKYSSEKKSSVTICCFEECEVDAKQVRAPQLKRYFIPEQSYFAVQAEGVFGEYSCFDAAYSAIDTARARARNQRVPSDPIEIYENYLDRGSNSNNFQSLILS